MKQLLIESIKYKDLIAERNGCWNHVKVETDKESQHIEKIYNYVRAEIIKCLNNKSNIGIGNVISFKLPDEYLKTVNNKQLKHLYVTYQPKSIAVKMKIKLYSDDNSEGDLHLVIHIDLFNYMFKTIFYHEMQHYYQLSGRFSSFQDLTMMNLATLEKHMFVTGEVRTLMQLVYKVNPEELNAYSEQLYNAAYIKSLQNVDVLAAYETIKTKYVCSNLVFNDLTNLIKSKQDVQLYVLILFMTNFDEIVGNKHRYVLFSNQFYQNAYVKKIRENISNIDLATGDISYDVYNHLKKCSLQMISEKPDLVNEILEMFVNRLTYYRRKAINRISNVLCAAYKDAEETKNIDYLRLNDIKLNDYVLFNKINDLSVEIVVDDSENDFIYYINGNSLYNIFDKFFILSNCEFDEDLEFYFGFDDIFKAPYEIYLNKISSEKKKKLLSYRQQFDNKDVKLVIDEINKLSI